MKAFSPSACEGASAWEQLLLARPFQAMPAAVQPAPLRARTKPTASEELVLTQPHFCLISRSAQLPAFLLCITEGERTEP